MTRADLQYDLLYFIFADSNRVFVDAMAPNSPLVNFCDLYVNALFNSTKCSKVLKDKMVETPDFAIEFAKIALLTNVGRINTTMACESLLSNSHQQLGIEAMVCSSFPRDEDGFTKLPSRSLSSENRR